MPQSFEKAVMTDAGAALLARSISESVSLEFTAIVIGDGTYSAAEKTSAALKQRTALKSSKMSYAPSAVSRESGSTVKVSAVISNTTPEAQPLFSQGFYINEVGLVAKLSNQSQTVLFSVCVTAGDQGDYLPAFTGDNPAQVVQDYLTAVSSEANVSFDMPLSAYALASDVADVIKYSPQTLSEANKAQARLNIGANAIVFTTVEPTEGGAATEPEGTLIAVYEG